MNVYGNPLKADPEEIVKLVIRSLFKMAIKKDPLRENQMVQLPEGVSCSYCRAVHGALRLLRNIEVCGLGSIVGYAALPVVRFLQT